MSGQFRRGDNLIFFDAVEKIHSATVYFDSPGGSTFDVIVMPPKTFNFLTPEDRTKYGIAFTRMNIPGYDPLP